jgi:phosphatidate cytidylyltransferase
MLDARLVTGALLVTGMLVGALVLPSAALAAVLLIVVWFAAWEWARLTGMITVKSRLIYLVIMTACAVGLWALSVGEWPLVPVLLGVLWWIVALGLLAAYRPGARQGRLKTIGLRLAGPLVLLPAWIAMINLHRLHPQPAWLVFLFLLVWVADSAAFFVGRRHGKTQLAPLISPAKTREGLLGAMVANAVLAVLGVLWFELPMMLWVYFISLCLLATLMAAAGDLFESLLKRYAGVKDSGVLLPGHGGVLDRIDSVLAAAPPFVLGVHWMN